MDIFLINWNSLSIYKEKIFIGKHADFNIQASYLILH